MLSKIFVAYSSTLVVLLLVRSSVANHDKARVLTRHSGDYVESNRPPSVPARFQNARVGDDTSSPEAIHIIEPPQYFQNYKSNFKSGNPKSGNPQRFLVNKAPPRKQYQNNGEVYSGSVAPPQHVPYSQSIVTFNPNQDKDCEEFVVSDTLSVSDKRGYGLQNGPLNIHQAHGPRVREREINKKTHTVRIDHGYTDGTISDENRKRQSIRRPSKRSKRQIEVSDSDAGGDQSEHVKYFLNYDNKEGQRNVSQDLLEHIANLILDSKELTSTKNCTSRNPSTGSTETAPCEDETPKREGKNIQKTFIMCKTNPKADDREVHGNTRANTAPVSSAARNPSVLVYNDVMQTIASGKNTGHYENQGELLSGTLPIFDITKYFPEVFTYRPLPQRSQHSITTRA